MCQNVTLLVKAASFYHNETVYRGDFFVRQNTVIRKMSGSRGFRDTNELICVHYMCSSITSYFRVLSRNPAIHLISFLTVNVTGLKCDLSLLKTGFIPGSPSPKTVAVGHSLTQQKFR